MIAGVKRSARRVIPRVGRRLSPAGDHFWKILAQTLERALTRAGLEEPPRHATGVCDFSIMFRSPFDPLSP